MNPPAKGLDVFDLGPAAHRMSGLVAGVRDDQLDDPTPCAQWTVGELLAHLHQFATVFTQNARKAEVHAPRALVDDWREAIPAQLCELAEAWRDEAAWTGRLSAGGVEMDARDNAIVAMEELTVHGWDLSRATGQDFTTDDASLDQIDRFFEVFGERIASGRGPYGPPVAAPAGADRFERTIARTGREPNWPQRG